MKDEVEGARRSCALRCFLRAASGLPTTFLAASDNVAPRHHPSWSASLDSSMFIPEPINGRSPENRGVVSYKLGMLGPLINAGRS